MRRLPPLLHQQWTPDQRSATATALTATATTRVMAAASPTLTASSATSRPNGNSCSKSRRLPTRRNSSSVSPRTSASTTNGRWPPSSSSAPAFTGSPSRQTALTCLTRSYRPSRSRLIKSRRTTAPLRTGSPTLSPCTTCCRRTSNPPPAAPITAVCGPVLRTGRASLAPRAPASRPSSAGPLLLQAPAELPLPQAMPRCTEELLVQVATRWRQSTLPCSSSSSWMRSYRRSSRCCGITLRRRSHQSWQHASTPRRPAAAASRRGAPARLQQLRPATLSISCPPIGETSLTCSQSSSTH
mmetsp:Transcript_6608/g.18394  ORF Transcript_6608/g.18394 Transcript_6608/m.18394 type:complete len:299 (-) Transcript_6608:853-1749(-)